MISTKDPSIDPTRIKELLGNRILIEWEKAPEGYLNDKLVRSDKYRSAYFTGKVIKVGLDVDLELYPLHEGDRVLFDQFSSPEKFIDPENPTKRYAILEIARQGAAFAIVPERVKIRSDEGDFDWEA